jgi:hypothetical protein
MFPLPLSDHSKAPYETRRCPRESAIPNDSSAYYGTAMAGPCCRLCSSAPPETAPNRSSPPNGEDKMERLSAVPVISRHRSPRIGSSRPGSDHQVRTRS